MPCLFSSVVPVATVIAAAVVLGWVAYLVFCGWLVNKTGESKSLLDAAVIARAFPIRLTRRLGRRRNQKLTRRRPQ
jgi:hypothetical protein